jgi:cytochrome bd ubiquinol oxidase subunit II
MAVAGLVVVHSDANSLYDGLVRGSGLPALIVSAAAGVATLLLVWVRQFEAARYGAVVAVAAMVAGWALAQNPVFLPGLTIQEAAASHDVLVAVIVAVVAGGVILFPSLGVLFRLVLHGRLDHAPPEAEVAPRVGRPVVFRSGLLGRGAAALLVAGFGLLNVAEAGWTHAVGAVCLLGFIVVGFAAAVPLERAGERSSPTGGARKS